MPPRHEFNFLRTGRRKLHDVAWQHCNMIDSDPHHVQCIYCGHIMWGGVSRLKEHLARKRGDVIACSQCPEHLTKEMQEYLIKRSHDRAEKQKKKREALENADEEQKNERETSEKTTTQIQANPLLQGGKMEEMDVEEQDLLNQSITESYHAYDMFKMQAATKDEEFMAACCETLTPYNEDNEFGAVCRESLCAYREELLRRGEGSSST